MCQLAQSQEGVLLEGGLRNPRKDPMCPLENQEEGLLRAQAPTRRKTQR